MGSKEGVFVGNFVVGVNVSPDDVGICVIGTNVG